MTSKYNFTSEDIDIKKARYVYESVVKWLQEITASSLEGHQRDTLAQYVFKCLDTSLDVPCPASSWTHGDDPNTHFVGAAFADFVRAVYMYKTIRNATTIKVFASFDLPSEEVQGKNKNDEFQFFEKIKSCKKIVVSQKPSKHKPKKSKKKVQKMSLTSFLKPEPAPKDSPIKFKANGIIDYSTILSSQNK